MRACVIDRSDPRPHVDLEAVGEFDLDQCAPVVARNDPLADGAVERILAAGREAAVSREESV